MKQNTKGWFSFELSVLATSIIQYSFFRLDASKVFWYGWGFHYFDDWCIGSVERFVCRLIVLRAWRESAQHLLMLHSSRTGDNPGLPPLQHHKLSHHDIATLRALIVFIQAYPIHSKHSNFICWLKLHNTRRLKWPSLYNRSTHVILVIDNM